MWSYLVGLENMCMQTGRKSVEPQVSIWPDGVQRRILPRLHPCAVQQVVHLSIHSPQHCYGRKWHAVIPVRRPPSAKLITHRLPVVEGFITVRDVAEQSCTETCRQQAFKCSGAFGGPHLTSSTNWPTKHTHKKHLKILNSCACLLTEGSDSTLTFQ